LLIKKQRLEEGTIGITLRWVTVSTLCTHPMVYL